VKRSGPHPTRKGNTGSRSVLAQKDPSDAPASSCEWRTKLILKRLTNGRRASEI